MPPARRRSASPDPGLALGRDRFAAGDDELAHPVGDLVACLVGELLVGDERVHLVQVGERAHPDAGLTTPNLAESETNRAFVRSARRVVVVADHTKWGIVGLSSFADLEEVDTLVTDEHFPAEARQQVADRVGQLIVAGQELPVADSLEPAAAAEG